jgi:hypothetical protein
VEKEVIKEKRAFQTGWGTLGSPAMPNCTKKPVKARKNATSEEKNLFSTMSRKRCQWWIQRGGNTGN